MPPPRARTPLPRTSCLLSLVVLVATGCDPAGTLHCGDLTQPMALVEVREAVLGDSIAQGATGFIEEGGVRINLKPAGDLLHLRVPLRRPGEYTVHVEKPGYAPFRRENVPVAPTGCAFWPVRVQAELDPLPLPEAPVVTEKVVEGLVMRLTLSHARVRSNSRMRITFDIHNPSPDPVHLVMECLEPVIGHFASFPPGNGGTFLGAPFCSSLIRGYEIAGGETRSTEWNVRAVRLAYDYDNQVVLHQRLPPGSYAFQGLATVRIIDGKTISGLGTMALPFEVE